MNITIDLKKKFLRKGYDVNIHVGCVNRIEAESIEVSFIQILSQIRSCDFEDDTEVDELCQSNKKEEEKSKEPPTIGFVDYVIGSDDGHEPFDEEEYEDE